MSSSKRASTFTMLICLTVLAVIAQISFFIVHYHVSDLLDSFVASSLKGNFFQPVIVLPVLKFIFLQLAAYALFILFIWFIATSCSQLFKISDYWLGLLFWLSGCIAILSLNNYFYPDSFFAIAMRNILHINSQANSALLLGSTIFLILATLSAYLNLLKSNSPRKTGALFLIISLVMVGVWQYDRLRLESARPRLITATQPNIILIGLDSLRPDFTGFFGDNKIQTPHIDEFLRSATTFNNAYAPLARTFPSWVSILTGQYPKHNGARINLDDPQFIFPRATLASRLQAAGYETIYATDEKRFSNITEKYGFDSLIGPSMGLDDFLLGGLSDFPLTNLLVNLPIGRHLFPFNYGNRAAAVTYEPNTFLHLAQLGLLQRQNKPLFLAIHFCISHWPYTWARDGQPDNFSEAQRYASSVEAVDQQLGELLQILKKDGLLEHSLVVLLSDHGTTVGLPGDRSIDVKYYQGKKERLKSISTFKYENGVASYNTSYGQGTDVLSPKQNHVLLAFRGFGLPVVPHTESYRSTLLDITPTILDYLNMTAIQDSDGLSLKASLFNKPVNISASRALFLESGYKISEIETNDIFIDKVIKRSIGLYQVSPTDGLLSLKPQAERSVIESKQRAILLGDWLLANYPSTKRLKFAPTSKNSKNLELKPYIANGYFVLVNLKTGKWTIGLDDDFAKSAPLADLTGRLKMFYGDEITIG